VLFIDLNYHHYGDADAGDKIPLFLAWDQV